SLNFDLFADLSHFQNWINDGIAVHIKNDSGLDKRAETGQSSLQTIGPNGKVGQNVTAGFVRDDCVSDARAGLSCRYLYPGQNRATLIADGSTDLGSCLRPSRRASQN